MTVRFKFFAIFALAVCAWAAPEFGKLTDSRDGKTYKTVKIGEQVWLAENLNYEYKIGGATYGNWCYDNNEKYCPVYGRYYTWGAAMDSVNTGCGYEKTCAVQGKARGVCPEGWHLPRRAEWDTLLAFVRGAAENNKEGNMLKSAHGWNAYEGKNGNGSDDYGFSVLPSDYRSRGGRFGAVGFKAGFWTSSEYGEDRERLVVFTYGYDYAFDDVGAKYVTTTIRCIKD